MNCPTCQGPLQGPVEENHYDYFCDTCQVWWPISDLGWSDEAPILPEDAEFAPVLHPSPPTPHPRRELKYTERI